MRLGRCLGFKVEHLAANHVADASRAGERQHQRGADGGISVGRRIGGDIEGIGQQRIADENRGRLVISLVRGRAAAAQIVIIKGGQIVVHQRIAVDHFQSRAGAPDTLVLDPEEPRRLDQQEWPQPLAAAEARIAHGAKEGGGPERLTRQRLFGQELVQHPLGGVGDVRQSRLKFLCHRVRHIIPASEPIAPFRLPHCGRSVKARGW